MNEVNLVPQMVRSKLRIHLWFIRKRGDAYNERFTKTNQQSPIELAAAQTEVQIGSWTKDDVYRFYDILEPTNWAPWLAASIGSLIGRAESFPKGQLIMKNFAGEYLASLSMNQIDWDGNTDHLPTWDDVAGDPTDYSQTFKPNGNTLVLMSMNVAPTHKGKKLPAKMIESATKIALDLGVTHFIGSFRPSGFGEAKKDKGSDLDFWQYCQSKKPDIDKPLDPWLRSLWWSGMEMIKVDSHAMKVTVSIDNFYHYQKIYKPESWFMVKSSIWECGEVGSWQLDLMEGVATYTESNVWGTLPLPK